MSPLSSVPFVPSVTNPPNPTPMPTATAPAPAKTGLKKVNLGGIAKAEEKKPGKKDYPVLPDPDGSFAKLADQLIRDQAAFDELEGAIKIAKAELTGAARTFRYEHLNGNAAPPSSISVKGVSGDEVLVTFVNR